MQAPRFRRLSILLSGLLLGGALLLATPVRADVYDGPSYQTPQQVEQTQHRRHLLVLFPAGVAVLTLGLILYNRRK